MHVMERYVVNKCHAAISAGSWVSYPWKLWIFVADGMTIIVVMGC